MVQVGEFIVKVAPFCVQLSCCTKHTHRDGTSRIHQIKTKHRSSLPLENFHLGKIEIEEQRKGEYNREQSFKVFSW